MPAEFPTASGPHRNKNVRDSGQFRTLRNRNHGRHCVPSSIKATSYVEGTLAILSSSIDKNAAEFRANAERMQALAAELQKRRAEAALGGPERARERHVARGKLLPRDRVMNLLDPASPFLELSPLAANGMYDDAIHGAGLITGIGRIEGRECMVVCNDSTIKGGTYFPMTVKKH